ncbi:EAL domain-containing protein [Pseudoalteromonas sp. S1612]|uniref:putative bifunctional diguanylate cyclase/phosphodiesterase n=1 Tax=Pseudoalteromonas sp. S1612 TaxID=579507 RepID=UPI00110A4604|nr:EAL domain-containing protein [Pseudoalteromonas sp. S1612]TMP53402.1 bifunctional diguanylate cyclase/phosphodiesterase [Pseudoalteromonas sp. S1612]
MIEIMRVRKLLSQQQSILSKIALGAPLDEVLENICLSIEELIEDSSAKCSILTLKGEQLFHSAAPNIAKGYCEAINGVHIGPSVGSCGTAVYEKKRVIASDIATSPLWENYKALALSFDLRSCWSTPIISTQSDILGTFAIYHDSAKSPTPQDLELIDFFVDFTSIALEKHTESLKSKVLLAELQQSNEKFKAFAKVLPDLTLILSEEGEYTNVYGTTNESLYLSQEHVINRNVRDIMPPEDANPIMAVIAKTLQTNEVQVFEYQLNIKGKQLTFEGRTAPLESYQPNNPSQRHVVWMARDISTRKAAEEEVQRLAFFDPLTNLPNRRMLNDKLSMYVEQIKQSDHTGALLFLDLDNFKRINDSLGHNAGDEILVELSQRLTRVLNPTDTLARVGGDEFIILIENVGDSHKQASLESELMAKVVQSVFYDKFEIGDLAFQVSCSIGICLINNANAISENILKFADTAMYRSKMKGGNSSSFYDPALQTLLENQTELETDIVRAIACDEFCAYFQPQLSIDGSIIGAEALIRWNHPTKGLISPNSFIPIAEQFGLIQKLQNIVLRDICILLETLRDHNALKNQFNVSINISQCQFNSSTLKGELFKAIETYDVLPSQIKLEITESMLAGDLMSTVKQMKELKSQGFVFSIDDFGTGYSCLKHLSVLPIDELKIDKSFIDKVLDNASGQSIVQSIIGLGHSLDINIVAEGVESAEQLHVLKSMGVNAVQGYLFAKPLTHSNYLKWHKEHQ